MMRDRESGFAVMVLLVAIGLFGTVVAGLAVYAVPAHEIGLAGESRQRLSDLAQAADEEYRRQGAFPTDLATLVASTAGTTAELTPRDPYGSGLDLDYSIVGDTLTLRCRGPDGAFNTADDLVETVRAQEAGRTATRNRLRILRAQYYMSPYMDDPGVSASDRVVLRTAMRDWATAQRQLVHAGSAQYTTLTNQIASATSTIQSILTTAGAPTPPSVVKGPGGLLEALNLPDSQGVDGFGNDLVVAVVGFRSPGVDGVAGNDDDL